ncbi:peptidoglycan-associated lipoprotein Pal [Saccharophagus degradans]|uniref:Peptidoglycan-associated lipoprotein n=1 Tax=Saccharophagus degradans (strain 2-40 / ATCC 43961 / DSM 17024) TaxID=203122 RepID=Q21HP1_SACD2|nr:peptidoglycan-associated lipoprotein Pal [Saccharophagus degradans]ABD81788.1 OmpA/MotB [Saccharophagus degradans 2-40]WGP00002.1 peptidoglycan-associated lipoprotein Pal [Saccharophagus degradans]
MSNIKTLLSLVAVFAFVSGCSSTGKTKGEADTDMNNTVEEQVETVVEVADPRDALIGVDTVFYFDFDQAMLRSEARAALLIHAKVIKETNASIRLEGHADERGSREYNMALGERRANAVRDFLVLQGVPSYSIETVSYGEERAAQVGSNESAWSKNRRVEIKY